MRRGVLIIMVVSVILISCTRQESGVNFTYKTGYQEAQEEIATGGFFWRPDYEGYPWAEMKNEVKGIPETWTDVLVKDLVMDLDQFRYQSYKAGIIDKDDLDYYFKGELEKTLRRRLSEKFLRCYFYVARGKDETGTTRYLIDSDNDHDFSNNTPVSLLTGEEWDKLSEEERREACVDIRVEVKLNGKVRTLTIPVRFVDWNGRGLGWTAFFRGEGTFLGKKFLVFPGSGLVFDYATFSYFQGPETYESFTEGDLFEAGGDYYRFQGADASTMTIRLEKQPEGGPLLAAQVGYTAPPFQGKEILSGDQRRLEDYRGQYVYLVFWSRTCPWCVKEIPYIDEARRAMKGKNIVFLGVTQTREEEMKPFMQGQGITLPTILSTPENDISGLYHIWGIPHPLLIGPDGTVLAMGGELRMDRLLPKLKEFIQEGNS